MKSITIITKTCLICNEPIELLDQLNKIIYCTSCQECIQYELDMKGHKKPHPILEIYELIEQHKLQIIPLK